MAKRKVIFISRLKEGVENQLIDDLKNSFPADALKGIDGLEEVTICQGNGMFAAVVEYDGDFEKIFSNYVSNPSVKSFHARLSAYLEDLPTSTKPAELPLVGDVLYWNGRKVQEAVG